MERSGTLALRLLSGPEGLLEIKKSWGELCSRMQHRQFFHCWPWYWSYINALETTPADVMLFVLYDQNDAVAIFPCKNSRQTFFGIKANVLQAPSHPHVPLADFICDSPARLPVLLKHLRQDGALDWDVLLLRSTPESSAACRALSSGCLPLAVSRCVGQSAVLPSLRYENTLARLDKKFRGNLRRARNRLQELDGVSVVTARSPEELAKAFSGFLQVEGSGWKGRKGTGSAIRLHPNVTKFYDLLWKGFAEQGRAAINLLLHMEKPIAGQFCLLIDDCCYVLKIGYDEDHAKLAPGNMLLEFLLKQYQDCSSVTNINLITSHDWQQSWKPDLVRVQELSLFNRSPKGIVLYSLNRTKNALRPWCTAPGSFGATT